MKHVATSNLEAQLFGLSTLVQLGKRARHAATAQELAFVMVNETNALVPYRQAVLWRREAKGRGHVVTISGSAAVERNAPITHWLNRALARLDSDTADTPRPVGAADLSGALGEEWAEWLPAYALWVPLALDPGHVLGALVLARDQPWSDGERHIVGELADSFAHAWAGFLGGRRRSLLARLWGGRQYVNLAIAAAVIGIMFLPITLSALAPAEVVPFQPTIVRAPLDGVVDHFAVAAECAGQGGPDAARARSARDPEQARGRRQGAGGGGGGISPGGAGSGVRRQEPGQARGAQGARRSAPHRCHLCPVAARSHPCHRESRRAGVVRRSQRLDRPAGDHRRAAARDRRSGAGRAGDLAAGGGRDQPQTRRRGRVLPQHRARFAAAGDAASDELRGDAVAGQSAWLPAQGHARRPSRMPRIGLSGTAKIYGEKVTLFYYLARRPLAAARQFLGL